MNEQEVAVEFILRRDRLSHPEGHTDKGGRWYPSDEERAECCASIREPSRSYPWTFYKHCNSAKHLAALYGVDVKQVKRFAGTDIACLMGIHPYVDTLIEKKFKGA